MQTSMETFGQINANLNLISQRLSSGTDGTFDHPNAMPFQDELQMEAPNVTAPTANPSLYSTATPRAANVTGRNTIRRSNVQRRASQPTPQYILHNPSQPTLTPVQQHRRQPRQGGRVDRYSDVSMLPAETIDIPYDSYNRVHVNSPSVQHSSHSSSRPSTSASIPPRTTPRTAPRRSSVPSPSNVSMPAMTSTPSRYNLHMMSTEPSVPDTTYRQVHRDLDRDLQDRQRHLSVSLHLHRDDPQDGLVAWLENNINGPYAGKMDKFSKPNNLELKDDEWNSFFFFYGKLRNLFTINGFHPHLLPPVELMHADINLSRPPMLASMLAPFGRNSVRPTQESLLAEHTVLGQVLHSVLLAAIDDEKCHVGRLALQSSFTLQDGFQVLMDMLKFFHPRLSGSQAPTFDSIKNIIPTCEQAGDVITYKASFDTWMERIALYPEYVTIRLSHVSIWFIDGLSQSSQDLLRLEKDALIKHRDHYKGVLVEPAVPDELLIPSLQAKLLRHFDTSTLLKPQPTSTRRVSHIDFDGRAVAAISASPSSFIVDDGNWDNDLLCQVCSFSPTTDPPSSYSIASIAGSGGGPFQRRGRTQHYSTRVITEKPVPCPYGPCGRIHPPNICCICGALTHKVDKCWHVRGVPDHVKTRLAGFQTLYKNKAPPYDNMSSQVSAIGSSSTIQQNIRGDNKHVPFGEVISSKQGHIEEAKEDAASSSRISEDVEQEVFKSSFLRRNGSVTAIDWYADDKHQTSEHNSINSLTQQQPIEDYACDLDKVFEDQLLKFHTLVKDIDGILQVLEAADDDNILVPTHNPVNVLSHHLSHIMISTITAKDNIDKLDDSVAITKSEAGPMEDLSRLLHPSDADLSMWKQPMKGLKEASPVSSKGYPKLHSDTDVLPDNYQVAEDGPEPPSSTDPSIAYIHVDSGATVGTTNREQELHEVLPTSVKCNTASKVGTGEVTGIGTLVFEATTVTGTSVRFTLGNTFQIPSFRRHTLSLHVLESMGFTVCQMLYGAQSALYIKRRSEDAQAMIFPLIRHTSSDFLPIKLTPPSYTAPHPVHGIIQVNAVNLATRLKGSQLWWLWHVRLGCPGHTSHKMMFHKSAVQGIANKDSVCEPQESIVQYAFLNYLGVPILILHNILSSPSKVVNGTAILGFINFIPFVDSNAFCFWLMLLQTISLFSVADPRFHQLN